MFNLKQKGSFQLEVINFIPNEVYQNIIDVVKQTLDYQIQTLIKVYENLILLFILIHQNYQYITQITLVLNSLALFVLIHLQYSSSMPLRVFIINIFINACIFIIIVGYLFILQSFTLICLIFSIFLIGHSKFLSCYFLSVGNTNDVIDKKIYSILPYKMVLYFVGVRLRKFYSSNDLNDPNHFYNMISGIQVIYLVCLSIADLVLQYEIKDQRFRIFLFGCQLLLLYYFSVVLSQFVNILRYGPYKRRIKLNCDKLVDLSQNQIEKRYFKFKKMQNLIVLEIQNYKPKEFLKVMPQVIDLIKQNKTLKLFVEENQQMHSSIQTFDNIIVSLLLNKSSLVKLLIKELATYDFNHKYFDISQNVSQFNLIIQQCIENYKIIPNIMSESLLINNQMYYQLPAGHFQQCEQLRQFKIEVMKIIVFDQLIKMQMDFQPQQIYYDLLDIQ
ncbi:transmembrane protein, putative (macronuclear) [Tetrahymena thermophila SB210]|uniref:Transmembrane protein, putative n=1 Tax=Tetrahymena thermophila (strain SB210) TaxID=312017 RepID=W7XLH8_TETTS|nr:transmembrane protein, putative [Tetrahymena thermophila SB210]EWS76314.1 transmembrane protein, putative [Tetrahymena thermophila SB210]|eukprot:XP_012651098.1 transmembrane protein, putative [Tetrahymena thermophila SB210]